MMGVLRNAVETDDRAALLRISEEMNDAKNKENFEENIDILESLIHDVWTLRMSGEDSRIVNTDLAVDLSRIADNAVGLDLASWLGAIETMRENFAVNINRKIAADALFVTMAGA